MCEVGAILDTVVSYIGYEAIYYRAVLFIF